MKKGLMDVQFSQSLLLPRVMSTAIAKLSVLHRDRSYTCEFLDHAGTGLSRDFVILETC